jgi:Coenzyme PQQ synthesis protein D (PqqD)
MTPDCLYRSKTGLRSMSETDGGFILDPTTGRCFGLDQVGALIWRALSTPQSFAQLCDAITLECPTTARDVIERDVSEFLDLLLAEPLIERVDNSAR